MSKKAIKVVLAKVGLDGHDRGINVISLWLRDAGMDVVYLGRFLTPEKVARSAVQEDADMIGLSLLGGEHLFHAAKMVERMKEHGLKVPLVIGGIIPEKDIPKLKEIGVSEVFPAGTSMEVIVQRIKELCAKQAAV